MVKDVLGPVTTSIPVYSPISLCTISYTLRAAALALLLPVAMLADLSQSPVLPSGQTLNLDTGAMSTSGGDIKFTGTSITL